MLARMAEARVELAAMEVSSHALAQHRAAGCRFAGAAFTNLTRDHLDYHGTMDAYFAAKASLFTELLPKDAPAVINLDDPRGAELAQRTRGRAIGYSASGAPGAELSAVKLQSDLAGISFELKAIRFASPLIGRHNAENLLAAVGLLFGLGHPLEELSRVAPDAKGAPGRLERVPDKAGRVVLVDYAHTDDALARVLDALIASRARGAASRIVTVFGCGGDRDKGKRPLMGFAAASRSELAIATSDNPRSEDPFAILRDIEPGLQKAGREQARGDLRAAKGYLIVPDRREAIALAMRASGEGDVVLIAGKGHEPYQIVGSERRGFDDRVEAARALREEGGGR